MSNELFSVPKRLPPYRPEGVPLVMTRRPESLSHRRDDTSRELDERVDRFRQHFNMRAEPMDAGDRLIFHDHETTLEVFRTSDSLWWLDDELSYPEKPPRGARLPSREQALEMAREQLRRLGLDQGQIRSMDVSYTEAAASTSPENGSEAQRTSIEVNISFAWEDLPVFGPGAKAQISMVDGGKMSEMLYFWRQPDETQRSRPIRLVTPEQALDAFMRDARFRRLSAENASVQLKGMELGYYAAEPGEAQKYLIPVYKVHGSAKTRELGTYDFTHYVVAWRRTPKQLKKMGVLDEVASRRIL